MTTRLDTISADLAPLALVAPGADRDATIACACAVGPARRGGVTFSSAFRVHGLPLSPP
jgi:hypothetical protein